MFHITECPRDAMQGISEFIPTALKIKYINALLRVGFNRLDCASFVSPKHVPQMSDSNAVLNGLENKGNTKISVIAPNKIGVENALNNSVVDVIGYTFSISNQFQLNNTNASNLEAFSVLEETVNLASQSNKKVLVYLSMAFGNPYNEEWNPEMLYEWVDRMREIGVQHFSVSDTTSEANTTDVYTIFSYLTQHYPELIFGAHFHSVYAEWFDKVNAAYDGGCREFDGALLGYGGCPFSGNSLTGNTPTEKLISFARSKQLDVGIDIKNFESAYNIALDIFNKQ